MPKGTKVIILAVLFIIIGLLSYGVATTWGQNYPVSGWSIAVFVCITIIGGSVFSL
jgi:hypothetical protein